MWRSLGRGTGGVFGARRRRQHCWQKSLPKVARCAWRRRNGISESLLYNWRSARKAAAVAAGAPEAGMFVPVGVVEDKVPRRPALLAPPELAPAPEFAPVEGQARPG
jgi:hypothetical protein